MAKAAKLGAATAAADMDIDLYSSEELPLLETPLSVQEEDRRQAPFRTHIHRTLTDRRSSRVARGISVFTFVLVCITVAFYVVRSMPLYWPIPPTWMWVPEFVSFSILLFIQVVRVASSPHPLATLTGRHVILTVIAIVPFVADLAIAVHHQGYEIRHFEVAVRFLEVFRVLMVRHISHEIRHFHEG